MMNVNKDIIVILYGITCSAEGESCEIIKTIKDVVMATSASDFHDKYSNVKLFGIKYERRSTCYFISDIKLSHVKSGKTKPRKR